MTGKRRAARQSVPAKAQKTEATRLHPAKQGEKIVGPKRRPTQESDVQPHPQVARSAIWKLEEAKAKFSEVVRRAHDQGDPNTSRCAASRRSQSSTPPNSNDCCQPTPRSFRSFNSWKASMSKAWI